MSTVMMVVLFIVAVPFVVALMRNRMRPPSQMALATLDFTNNRRRAPHTRRPPPGSRAGAELSFRVPR